MESILTSIKKLLGVSEDYTQFDPDIIMHINSVLMDLNQLGVGPSYVFSIEDDTSTWFDFVPNVSDYGAIKSYIYLRVKLLFDSATLNSATIASIEKQIERFEWRLNVAADTTGSTSSSGSSNSGNTNTGTGGSDGFSPVIVITNIAGGHRVTITDIKGTKWFDVLDGAKGEPYVLTEEDKVKIVAAIQATLGWHTHGDKTSSVPADEVSYTHPALIDDSGTIKGALDEAITYVTGEMPDAVAKKHEHDNKSVLDGFEDIGLLLYNGSPLVSAAALSGYATEEYVNNAINGTLNALETLIDESGVLE